MEALSSRSNYLSEDLNLECKLVMNMRRFWFFISLRLLILLFNSINALSPNFLNYLDIIFENLDSSQFSLFLLHFRLNFWLFKSNCVSKKVSAMNFYILLNSCFLNHIYEGDTKNIWVCFQLYFHLKFIVFQKKETSCRECKNL